MSEIYYKSSLRSWTIRMIGLVILIMLVHIPRQAYAQWPPFSFGLTPTYSNGQITYHIKFSNKAEWAMADMTFKIPLPAGTRFLEASAPPSTSVTFDGAEVTFLTAVPNQSIKTAYFTVEVTDPALTIFTTHAWLVWKGDQPGDYLTEEVSIDITNPQQPLNWEEPARASVQLEAGATVTDTIIAYTIYPTNVTGRRIWDLKVNVPLPEGTTFLAAEAPAPFVANFDGQEVSFSILELESRTEAGPLRFTVSSDEAVTPFAVTHSWATWKNTGSSVGRSVSAQEETGTGDIVVQPHTAQQVVADIVGDVPFSNYDLTSVALQEDRSALKITFYTAGSLGPVGEPLEYYLYIDSDCGADTGQPKKGLGLDYRVRYRHEKGQADIRFWQETEVVTEDGEANADDADAVVTTKGGWSKLGSIEEVISPADGQMVAVWVPYDLIDIGTQFCWMAEARNRTKAFTSNLPPDRIPNNEDLRLTNYKVLSPAVESAVTGPFTTTAVYRGSNQANAALVNNSSAPSSPPSITDINGKLAVPIDNGQGLYDVHIFSMPDGQEISKLSNARQPNFRFDGQRLLINREGGGTENVYEYNFTDGAEKPVSDATGDSYPFYDPPGNRVVYGNVELTIGADGSHHPYIYVQCGLLVPHQETEPRCRDIPGFGILTPAGQMGEIQGTHPVWTANDMIVYQGCNSWAGYSACGIYMVSSASTRGFSDGFIPRQLTQDPSDTPTDTKGNLIAFMSYREGNWEVYVMDLNGTQVKNLSNSPDSNDGLATISPDSNWITFISDRGGQWAVWVTSTAGGPAEKLFDLPSSNPWGDGDRTWTNERISWGP